MKIIRQYRWWNWLALLILVILLGASYSPVAAKGFAYAIEKLDDNDPSITVVYGTWEFETIAGAYGGSVSKTSTAGGAKQGSFEGDSFTIHYYCDPGATGSVSVYVAGLSVGNFSQNSCGTGFAEFTSSGHGAGSHVWKIANQWANAPMYLDAVSFGEADEYYLGAPIYHNMETGFYEFSTNGSRDYGIIEGSFTAENRLIGFVIEFIDLSGMGYDFQVASGTAGYHHVEYGIDIPSSPEGMTFYQTLDWQGTLIFPYLLTSVDVDLNAVNALTQANFGLDVQVNYQGDYQAGDTITYRTYHKYSVVDAHDGLSNYKIYPIYLGVAPPPAPTATPAPPATETPIPTITPQATHYSGACYSGAVDWSNIPPEYYACRNYCQATPTPAFPQFEIELTCYDTQGTPGPCAQATVDPLGQMITSINDLPAICSIAPPELIEYDPIITDFLADGGSIIMTTGECYTLVKGIDITIPAFLNLWPEISFQMDGWEACTYWLTIPDLTIAEIDLPNKFVIGVIIFAVLSVWLGW